eukprot:gnl/MRDRNA2_/MRDRNA2_83917_c0_seq1.p1 gnl/MRDRNA2_/MRDRNA2_83917_c0~~gnl/MRDRNA2_/MRDRNA2_83917_c0_seq1.p1  ORF type:complete len:141 (+),score=15.15 gnl/MRDRNA2_/MRDRNA2_83917_c0_seq1:1-423(+)
MVDAKDTMGNTALHYACGCCTHKICFALLNSAKMTAVNDCNSMGNTALTRAVQAGSLTTCETLLASSQFTAVDGIAIQTAVQMNRLLICKAILNWAGWVNREDVVRILQSAHKLVPPHSRAALDEAFHQAIGQHQHLSKS